MGILLLLWIVGAAFPEQRTWGFSHAAYVPPYLAAILFLLCILALQPSVSLRVGSFLEGASLQLAGGTTSGVAAAVIAALIAGPFFYLLAIPFSFLGDSFLYLAEIIRTTQSGQVDFFRYNSLLTSFIFLYLGSKIMTFFSIVEVVHVFWLITSVCGMIFVFVIVRGIRSIAEQAIDAAILIGLIVGLGGWVLFFGYVEHYAPLFAATTAYAMSLYRATTRRGSLTIPAALLALCVSFHFLAVFYIPSFLIALYQRWLEGRDRECSVSKFRWLVVTGLVVFIAASAAVMMFRLPPLFASLIPLSEQSWTGTYTMLTSYHLIDLVNEFLLVAAVPTAIASGLLLSKRVRINMGNHAIQVFSVLLLSLTLLAAFHFPFYGMARDLVVCIDDALALHEHSRTFGIAALYPCPSSRRRACTRGFRPIRIFKS
jgi:hypothetical protein